MTVANKLDIDKPVYFAGHSKGGPESILYAYFAHHQGFKVKRAATFGCPQWITRGGAMNLLHLSIVQYRNGRDLVTALPSQTLKIFQHVRDLTQIGDADATPWDIDVHGIDHYIEELKKCGNT